MKKPYGMQEYDGYPMPDVPKDRPRLSKEDEDRLIADAIQRLDKKISDKESEKVRKIG